MKSVLILILAALLNSCLTSGDLYKNAIKSANVDSQAVARAETYREITNADNSRNGVYVYARQSYGKYAESPEVLVARVKLLGFTDIYIGASLDADRDGGIYNWVRSINAEAHKLDMKVHIIFDHRVEFFESNESALTYFRNKILAFNEECEVDEQFDGISSDIEPHIVREPHMTELCPWFWGAENYGIGNNNDILMRRNVEVMEAVRDLAGDDYEISQTTLSGVQSRYNEGEIQWGTPKQFIETSCDWIIIMAYSKSAQGTIARALPTLKANESLPKSVNIAIDVEAHQPDVSLYYLGWDKMLESIDEIVAISSEYESYRGFDIFHFRGLEDLWLNKF